MTDSNHKRPYILGLDLGVSSIGWALIEATSNQQRKRIIRAGVHLFEAGVDGGKQDAETALQKGNEKSRAQPRRDARQQRRQTWRRAYRKRKLLNRLIRCGLLPQPDQQLDTPAAIDAYMKSLDCTLRKKWEEKENADHCSRQLLPYRMRAQALNRPLDPAEIGRALYHLAQRRGFLSNRKTDQDEADDSEKNTGTVKSGISELEQLMEDAGAETLGQFFASLDPSDPNSRRIRGRWTGRSMYEHEFKRIWEAQSKHHPEIMTNEARQEIRDAIFDQRPLKSQRHLIGHCSLLPNKRRAPIADRLYQRFRMLQKVNDLEIIPHKQIEEEDFDKETGEVKINPKTGNPKMKKRLVPDPDAKQRPLTESERDAAIARLSKGDATFHQLRQAGAAPKHSRFNFETDGEKGLIGLRTDEKLQSIFGNRWEELSETQKDAVVEDCLSFERADAMEKRGREHWGLPPEDARAFARTNLEEGYGSYSRAAIRKLLPLLEQGVRLQSARQELFPDSFATYEPSGFLRPLNKTFYEPLSPAVARALSEMRKVVNAIIRRYGKPEHVRVELLRHLKKGRTRRANIEKQITARRTVREKAAERLLQQYPGRSVSEIDKLKVLLADECRWQCPYTGRCFGWEDLFGHHPTIDIEHIWPFKRSLDNTFFNKTLSCVRENRNVKRDHMPAEVYSGERLENILQRVAKFKGDAAREKLERFKAESIPAGFTERHLTESKYIARKAAEYVAQLYGGLSDDEHNRRVHVTTGGLTGWLRREWGMNAILSDRDEKERSDHRHHAIDAIIVALTTPATVQKLQKAAARADDNGSRKLFADIEAPFDFADARRAIEAIVVSHRQNRKARGKFHKDTIYSRPYRSHKTKCQHRFRKELHKLYESDIDLIIDPRIRETVRTAYENRKKQGAKDPTQAFSDPQHRPQLPNGDRIRRVRIITNAQPEAVGSDARKRRVDLQANHHTVIMAKLNKDGSEKTWVDKPVALLDAMDRAKDDSNDLVSREVPKGHRFKFTLAANEYIELDRPDGHGRTIYRILNISAGFIEIREHCDGRTRRELKDSGVKREIARGSLLYKRNAQKVHVNYLGEVHNAGG